MHLDVAPGHERHGNKTAASPHQRGNHADSRTGTKHACRSGQMARRRGFGIKEHFCGRSVDKHGKNERNPEGRQCAGNLSSHDSTDDNAWGHRKHNIPENRAALGVCTHRGERREKDRAH